MKLKNEKVKNFKIRFVFKLKNKLYYRYADNPCTESITLFSNLIEIENCQFRIFPNLI